MTAELDSIDRDLVALLQQDARRTNKDLADAVGIAQSTCSARVHRLAAIGVVTGYHASIAPKALGIGLQAMVSVSLIRHGNTEIAQFWGHIDAVPEAVSAFHMTGETDFLVHVVARDSDHLQELTTSTFTAWPEVARIRTAVVYSHRPRTAYPDISSVKSR